MDVRDISTSLAESPPFLCSTNFDVGEIIAAGLPVPIVLILSGDVRFGENVLLPVSFPHVGVALMVIADSSVFLGGLRSGSEAIDAGVLNRAN